MNTSALLHVLEQQVQQIADMMSQTEEVPSAQARFDIKLFNCRGTHLRNYVEEVQGNFAKLQKEVTNNHLTQVEFLAERIVSQIEALKRELATLSLRKKEPVKSEQQDIYQRLAEHQDYERRLLAMIQDRESLLNSQETLAQQAQTQREIAALEMRLSRCRQALQRLERYIEKRENGHYA